MSPSLEREAIRLGIIAAAPTAPVTHRAPIADRKAPAILPVLIGFGLWCGLLGVGAALLERF